MKPMKLQIQGLCLARAPSMAMVEALNKYSHLSLFFIKWAPKFYKLQASQNLNTPLVTEKQRKSLAGLHF
jgi:hypothetical protein